MAFCGGCGADVPAGSAFCKQCGRPVAAGQTSSPGAPPPVHHSNPGGGAPATAGLAENVAGALCYVLGWLTGIIFLVIDKRHSVRFHAAQSIVVFGGLFILYWIVGSMFAASIMLGGLGMGWSLGYVIFLLLRVIFLVLWIFLMFKAYQGEQFRVPVAANIADSLVGKTPA
jgi:uncharacterized membrane protein